MLRHGRLFCVSMIFVVSVASVTTTRPGVAENDLLPSATVDLENVTVRLRSISGGFDRLTDFAPDGTGRHFVCQYDGAVFLLDTDSGASSLYLDTYSGATFNDLDTAMTSIAFHPEFGAAESPGFAKFYTVEPERANQGSPDFVPDFGRNQNHQSVIYEYTVDDIAAAIFSGTKREIMRVQQPANNHNVNDLAFDRSGLLYIAFGDGKNDEFVALNAQEKTNVYGKILRIDPLGLVGTPGANGAYSIPDTNPFVGEANVREEIFAYGLRNPYRINFDRLTGALYSGCIGQDDIEEINLVEAGGNYGWDLKEGSYVYHGHSSTPTVDLNGDLARASNFIDPLFEQDHQDGATIIGGFVYRGSAISELEGRYVFADFQGNRDDDPVPNRARLFYGNVNTGDRFQFNIDIAGEPLPTRIYSIGQDDAGELYVLGESFVFKVEPSGGSVEPVFLPQPTARWTLDAEDIVDDVVIDRIGNFDGTVLGESVNTVAGWFSEGLDFPGSDDDYVDFGHVLDPGDQSFTVSLWFNADALQGDPKYILHKGNNDSSVPGWSIWVGEGNGRIHCRGNWCAESPGCTERNEEGKFGRFIDDQAFIAGEWHHLAYVIDRQTNRVRAYLDGSDAGWSPGGGGAQGDILRPGAVIAPEPGLENSNPTLRMGRRIIDGAPYSGSIDDVMIWKGTALTAAQVLGLAIGTEPGGVVDDPQGPPATPTGLTAVAEDGRVSLKWADNSEADLRVYNVKRSTNEGGPHEQIASTPESAFIDDSVDNGTTYYYEVSASDFSDNESSGSDEVSETPAAGLDLTSPPAPASLGASVGDGEVQLRWDAVTDRYPPGANLEGYNVKRSLTTSGPYDFVSQVNTGAVMPTEFTDTTVTNDTTYFYVVTAVDLAGNESAPSAEVAATPSALNCPGAPVAFWTLDTADIFDTVVFDSAGTSDGEIRGTGVTNPLGFIGDALKFPDSARDYVLFGEVLDPGTESYTVSMWVNFDSLDLGFVFGKENGEGSVQSRAGWSIFVENDQLLIVRAQQTDPRRGNDDIVEQRIAGQGGLVGQWSHIAMVIDRENDVIRGYLNGSTDGWFNPRTAEGFIPGSRIESIEPLLMAKTNTNPRGAFGGLIDEVAIWRRALEVNQIESLATGRIRPNECDDATPFRRGDGDGSGRVDMTDPINNLKFQFLGGFAPMCFDALDTDDSGTVDLSDPIRSLTFLFLGGVEIPAPGLDCGVDPTFDSLGCAGYPEEEC